MVSLAVTESKLVRFQVKQIMALLCNMLAFFLAIFGNTKITRLLCSWLDPGYKNHKMVSSWSNPGKTNHKIVSSWP